MAYKIIENQREWDALEDELRRGCREIYKNTQSVDGWADRIMSSILRPLKDNLNKYPIGRGRPDNLGGTTIDKWGEL